MNELKIRVSCSNFPPELPHAETIFAHVDVMKENDATGAHLGNPRGEIFVHGFIGMETVDMKEINGCVREARKSTLKAASHQRRKRAVEWIVIGLQIGIDLLAISTGVLVPSPVIDPKASCRQGKCLNGL